MPTQIYKIIQKGNSDFLYVGSTAGGIKAIRKMVKRIEGGRGYGSLQQFDPNKGRLVFEVVEKVDPSERPERLNYWRKRLEATKNRQAPKQQNQVVAVNPSIAKVVTTKRVEVLEMLLQARERELQVLRDNNQRLERLLQE